MIIIIIIIVIQKKYKSLTHSHTHTLTERDKEIIALSERFDSISLFKSFILFLVFAVVAEKSSIIYSICLLLLEKEKEKEID